MPRKAMQSKAKRPFGKKRASEPAASTPLLEPADVRTILFDLAKTIAPTDVSAMMEDERTLRREATELQGDHLSLLRDQLNLALDCLRDHVDGLCPQIPYFTICLLAAAVYYFSDELDVIPDFLPAVGRLDDAVVMEMACELGEAGLRRYCDWKSRSFDAIMGRRGAPA